MLFIVQRLLNPGKPDLNEIFSSPAAGPPSERRRRPHCLRFPVTCPVCAVHWLSASEILTIIVNAKTLLIDAIGFILAHIFKKKLFGVGGFFIGSHLTY